VNGPIVPVSSFTIHSFKEGQLHGSSTGPIDSLKGAGRMMRRMAELCPLRSNLQRAHEEIEIPRYSERVSRTLSPTFQIHSSPSSESWVHMIWMRKDIQARHVEVHVQNAGRPIIRMCRDLTIRVMGDRHSEDQLLPFQGGTNPHPHYKYPQTFRYGLAKIIAIKHIPLIHILLRIDLNIGVGSVDTPQQAPLSTLLFCKKRQEELSRSLCYQSENCFNK